jgi:Na+/H+-translocating membrane pyrophosphatase
MIMAVEVARKTRPTDLDQTGRDTYSSYLGRGRAVILLLAILFTAQALFSLVAGVPIWLAVSLALPALVCVYYLRADSNSSAKAVLNGTVLFLTINMIAAMAVHL